MPSAPPPEIDPDRCFIGQLGLRCPAGLCTECKRKDGQSAGAARQSDRHTSGHHCTTNDRQKSRVIISASAQSAWPLIQNVDWDERGLSEKHRDWKQWVWIGYRVCQHSYAVASKLPANQQLIKSRAPSPPAEATSPPTGCIFECEACVPRGRKCSPKEKKKGFYYRKGKVIDYPNIGAKSVCHSCQTHLSRLSDGEMGLRAALREVFPVRRAAPLSFRASLRCS